MGSSNRIIGGSLQESASVGETRDTVKITDDNGQNWTTKYGPVASGNFLLGPVGSFGGEELFVVEHVAAVDGANELTQVVRSTNAGTDWTRMKSAALRNSLSDDPNGGIAYDEREDALYVANKGGQTAEAFYISRMAPAQDLASWADFSDTSIPPAETKYDHPEPAQSIAIIP